MNDAERAAILPILSKAERENLMEDCHLVFELGTLYGGEARTRVRYERTLAAIERDRNTVIEERRAARTEVDSLRDILHEFVVICKRILFLRTTATMYDDLRDIIEEAEDALT